MLLRTTNKTNFQIHFIKLGGDFGVWNSKRNVSYVCVNGSSYTITVWRP